MIYPDQACKWLWERYLEARTMEEIDYWYALFTLNRNEQIYRAENPANL